MKWSPAQSVDARKRTIASPGYPRMRKDVSTLMRNAAAKIRDARMAPVTIRLAIFWSPLRRN